MSRRIRSLKKKNYTYKTEISNCVTRLKKRGQVQRATLSLLGAKAARNLIPLSRNALIVHIQENKTMLIRLHCAERVIYTLNVMRILK